MSRPRAVKLRPPARYPPEDVIHRSVFDHCAVRVTYKSQYITRHVSLYISRPSQDSHVAYQPQQARVGLKIANPPAARPAPSPTTDDKNIPDAQSLNGIPYEFSPRGPVRAH